MITSFRNPLVKRIKRLRQKKYRQREAAFYVEGIRPVLSALEYGADVETLVYAPELLTSETALAAVSAFQEQGGEVVPVASDVFASLSERDNPVGLGAIVRLQLHHLEELAIRPATVFVLLQDVSDPGNLGTILRTVDAAGADGVIMVGETVDPFHPAAVKASMGTLFTVPVAVATDMQALWAWAESNNLVTVATSAHAQTDYREAAYTFPLLLLMGSEGSGLARTDLEQARLSVSIPMRGSASSLNLAVATGLLLYEVTSRLAK